MELIVMHSGSKRIRRSIVSVSARAVAKNRERQIVEWVCSAITMME